MVTVNLIRGNAAEIASANPNGVLIVDTNTVSVSNTPSIMAMPDADRNALICQLMQNKFESVGLMCDSNGRVDTSTKQAAFGVETTIYPIWHPGRMGGVQFVKALPTIKSLVAVITTQYHINRQAELSLPALKHALQEVFTRISLESPQCLNAITIALPALGCNQSSNGNDATKPVVDLWDYNNPDMNNPFLAARIDAATRVIKDVAPEGTVINLVI